MKLTAKIFMIIVALFVVKIFLSKYDIHISNLPCDELSFQELPQDVQSVFLCTTHYQTECILDNDFFEESTQFSLMPWIYESWLFDASRKITYKMDSEPILCVVFNDTLYQLNDKVNSRNIEKLNEASFSSYELRTEKIAFFCLFFVRLKDRLHV